MNEQESIASSTRELATYLKEKLNISDIDAIRVATISAQMKMGYTLTMYPKAKVQDVIEHNDMQTCIINCISDGDILLYEVTLENLNMKSLLLGLSERHTKTVTFQEFIDIVLNVAPNTDMSLSMNFTWERLCADDISL